MTNKSNHYVRMIFFKMIPNDSILLGLFLSYILKKMVHNPSFSICLGLFQKMMVPNPNLYLYKYYKTALKNKLMSDEGSHICHVAS